MSGTGCGLQTEPGPASYLNPSMGPPILSCKCVYKLSSSGGMTRAIESPECPPGAETSAANLQGPKVGTI